MLEGQQQGVYVGNDAVELAPGITKAMLTDGQLSKVLGSLWDVGIIELESDATMGLLVDCNVELCAKA